VLESLRPPEREPQPEVTPRVTPDEAARAPAPSPHAPEPEALTEHEQAMVAKLHEAIDLPMSEEQRADIVTRVKYLDGMLKRVSELELDPATRVELENELENARIGLSGTANKDHGAIAGTDGGAIARANFHEADLRVKDWVQNKAPITVERIQELNAMLGHGLANNRFEAGRLRYKGIEITSGGNRMASFLPGASVHAEMHAFVDWYHANEGTMEPAELAARTYQWLISIHPFKDANGRTTRLVMDWVLQRHGLPPATLNRNESMVAIFPNVRLAHQDDGHSPYQATVNVLYGLHRTLEHVLERAEGK
jgi:Fic family protein